MIFLALFGIFVAFVILIVSVLLDERCRWKQPQPWHMRSFKRKNPEV